MKIKELNKKKLLFKNYVNHHFIDAIYILFSKKADKVLNAHK